MAMRMCVWILLTLFSVVSEWYGHCCGCLEEERIGLLEIQAFFDPNRLSLRDWVDKDGIGNCCEWSGIECDNTTRRVIQLSLMDVMDRTGLGDLILNASLFLPFEELQSLNLRGNRLVGLYENQGFQVLSSKLKKLEILGLTQNQFNESILSSLSGLSSLKSLYLSQNNLTGSAGFYGNTLSGFEVLAPRLKKLENLDLGWNKYNDSSIFPSLSEFQSLKFLDLSGNMLNGSTSFNGKLLIPVSGFLSLIRH
ncbi:unnamed protein product [Dovyalis caffra]|uniref:Leucine-rich repeat-containing N-terminal plant-type domain-containing protein n=1 Tax=Dovyalis caffra TaxID=77055 RepID=A0AAV1RVU3_9ROSI|nr:unnamed protein product [Dovyalis caffra]